MTDAIVDISEPITLVGGAAAHVDVLADALDLAPTCVAVDGGAALALSAGVDPVAVIGDFDSVTATTLGQVPQTRQHRIDEQSTTDFEKALMRVNAPVILGVGFTGGRVDHQLAALNTLLAYAHQPCVLMTQDEIILLAPPEITLPTQAGEVVSLFPLEPVTGASTGLEWPIEGLNFAPGGQIGTSNRALGPCSLTMGGPGMLLILPRRFLSAVTQHFVAHPNVRWPALAQ